MFSALVATVMIGLGTGCVTADRTSLVGLPVHTTPVGSTVKTNGVAVGVTPVTITLPRMAGKKGNEVAVTVILEGYQTQDFVMRSRISWEGFFFLLQRFPVTLIFGKSASEPGSALDLVPRQIDTVLIPLRPAD